MTILLFVLTAATLLCVARIFELSARSKEWLRGLEHAKLIHESQGIARLKYEVDNNKGHFKEGMQSYYWSVINDTRP